MAVTFRRGAAHEIGKIVKALLWFRIALAMAVIGLITLPRLVF
jgi:hypothetical protein